MFGRQSSVSMYQASTKLFEKGGADCAPGPYAVFFFFTGPPPASKVAQVLKKLMSTGEGGTPTLFFPSLKILGQVSRHGVGISSYITNLYNKQASNNKKEKKEKVFTS